VVGAGSTLRVVRGGSFGNNADNLRAANRNRNNPDNRNDNIGFRVVSSRSSSTFDGAGIARRVTNLAGRGEERRSLFPAESGIEPAGRIEQPRVLARSARA
jgi:hypothetical protein